MSDETLIHSSGALPDTRPAEAKAKDFPGNHLIAAAVATFQNAKPTVLGATEYDQWYVGDCVLHGFYTQLEYEGIVPASPEGMSQLRAYRKRANYPEAGTGAVDGYTKIKQGQSKNADAPTTPGMTEDMASAMPLIVGDKLIPEFNYYEFAGLNHYTDKREANDAAVMAVAGGKAVSIFIYATNDEWSREYVEATDPNVSILNAYIRHCVCIMPKGDFTENGKQWLAVHDSAKFGGRHLRYISMDFFIKRAFYAGQVFKKGDVPAPIAFHYTFTKPLKFQSTKNDPAEVHALQQALQYLKRADGSHYMVPGTFGPYGPATRTAVGLFQTDQKITDPDGQGTNFGPKSREAMNAALSK